MTRNHNLAPLPAGVGGSSVSVWEVYPFRLKLLCSADAFHRQRARIRMKAGYKALNLVADAMVEQELWNARSEEQRAKDAKLTADVWQATEQDKKLLGI